MSGVFILFVSRCAVGVGPRWRVQQDAWERRAGEPPKSSCWFCPFHRPEHWVALRAQHPDLFERALELEDMLNRRRELLGRDPVSLHASGLPLGVAVDRQERVAGMEFAFCDSGHCMT